MHCTLSLILRQQGSSEFFYAALPSDTVPVLPVLAEGSNAKSPPSRLPPSCILS